MYINLTAEVVWEWLFFAVCMLTNRHHFDGVNWPTTRKQRSGVHFFTLNFECHDRYIKLLLCVLLKMVASHDAMKTIQTGVFTFFFTKRTKTCFFFKKRVKNTGGLRFFLKTGFSHPDACASIRRSWCDYPHYVIDEFLEKFRLT